MPIQTSNLRFIVDNLVTNSTITVLQGTEEASLPCSNLKNYSKASYSRINISGGAAGIAEYRVQLPSISSLSAVVLGPSNFDSDTIVTLKLYNSSDVLLDTITAEDVAPVVPFGTFVWGIDPLGAVFSNKFTTALWFTPVANVSYFKLSITGSTTAYYNIAYVFAGVYIEPSRDPSRGLGLQYADSGSLIRTEDGTLRSSSGIMYRKFSLSLQYMDEADRLLLLRFINKRRPFVVSMFQRSIDAEQSIHMETDYTALVKVTGDFEVTSNFYGLYDTSLSLEEV